MVKTTFDAAAWVIVNAGAVVVEVKVVPESTAVSTLSVPIKFMLSPLLAKLATPATAVSEVVPASVPVPVVRVRSIVRVEFAPVLTTFPEAS